MSDTSVPQYPSQSISRRRQAPYHALSPTLREVIPHIKDAVRCAAVYTLGLRFIEAQPYGKPLWTRRSEILFRTQREVGLTLADLDIALEVGMVLGFLRKDGYGDGAQYAIKLDPEESGLSEQAVTVIAALRTLRQELISAT